MPLKAPRGLVRSKIIGTGAGIPRKVLTNFDLEKMVDTSDEWIVQRTGIRERRIGSNGESSITFITQASQAALEEAGLDPEEIDLIIVGTHTPDMTLPSSACLLQKNINAKNSRAFDLTAGCTGWIYGLVIADNFIKVNPEFKALIVGSEFLSNRLDWEDRTTCVLFGDGAGAAVVVGSEDGRGLLATCLMSDGTEWEALTMIGPGSMNPVTHDLVDKKLHVVRMDGNRVFKLAVPAMEEVSWYVLTEAGYSPADVDAFIPHQANIRIMEAVAKRLGIPLEKVIITVDKYGNTSSASIPVALSEASRDGRIKKGDMVLLASFGGGFTWGAVLLRW